MQERLNQIIEKKGLTATKFAAMIGVNASTISIFLQVGINPVLILSIISPKHFRILI